MELPIIFEMMIQSNMMDKLLKVMNFMKNIARFEGRYSITANGGVWNHANNSFLTPIMNPNGYLKVGLANGKEGGQKQLSVHRLVALHYILNPYEHPQVNHINGIKTDNRVENLEWCTSSENNNNALATGLRPGYMSADDKEAYLNRVLTEGIKIVDLAMEIGRRPETLSKMLRDTAKRVSKYDQWLVAMKRSRHDAALRGLAKINTKNTIR